jgi:hypothetical protein
MDNKSASCLRVTKSPNDNLPEEEKSSGKKEKPLSHQELMAQIATKGTIYERELCVVENLRRMGLH